MTPRKFFVCQLCEATSAGTEVRKSKIDPKICSWCADQLARTNCRRCRKCNTVGPLPFGSTSHGRWCLACSRVFNAARYEKAKEQWTAANRARYQAKRAQRRATERAYRMANRDAINAHRRAQYAANPEPRRAAAREWHARHDSTHTRWRDRHPGAAAAASKRYRIRKKLAILREWR